MNVGRARGPRRRVDSLASELRCSLGPRGGSWRLILAALTPRSYVEFPRLPRCVARNQWAVRPALQCQKCGVRHREQRPRRRSRTRPTRAPSTPGRLIMEHWRLWEPKHTQNLLTARDVYKREGSKTTKKARRLVTCTSTHAAPRPRRGARRSSTSRCGTARTAAPSTRRRRRRSARAC